jgi:hypothetical protein
LKKEAEEAERKRKFEELRQKQKEEKAKREAEEAERKRKFEELRQKQKEERVKKEEEKKKREEEREKQAKERAEKERIRLEQLNAKNEERKKQQEEKLKKEEDERLKIEKLKSSFTSYFIKKENNEATYKENCKNLRFMPFQPMPNMQIAPISRRNDILLLDDEEREEFYKKLDKEIFEQKALTFLIKNNFQLLVKLIQKF